MMKIGIITFVLLGGKGNFVERKKIVRENCFEQLSLRRTTLEVTLFNDIAFPGTPLRPAARHRVILVTMYRVTGPPRPLHYSSSTSKVDRSASFGQSNGNVSSTLVSAGHVSVLFFFPSVLFFMQHVRVIKI